MDFDITTVLNIVAIIIMFYCMYLVMSLKSKIPGGMVGKYWNFLTILVGLFSVTYLATPFFGNLPIDTLRLLVSLIFIFGAVYVVITVHLIYNIIRELTE
jgi:ABC-type multidrug transport system permease subunit